MCGLGNEDLTAIETSKGWVSSYLRVIQATQPIDLPKTKDAWVEQKDDPGGVIIGDPSPSIVTSEVTWTTISQILVIAIALHPSTQPFLSIRNLILNNVTLDRVSLHALSGLPPPFYRAHRHFETRSRIQGH